MAQAVILKLSPAEWILAVMTVQPDAVSTLAETVNVNMSPERLQGALQAARDGLLARDLARTDATGKLEINPVVLSCARTLLNPQLSFGLTQIEADGTSQVSFYNSAPGFAIGTWVDANQIRSFELIGDARNIAERVLTNSGNAVGAASASPPVVKSYSLNAAGIPALPVDRAQKVDGLSRALTQGGLPAEESAALERAFASPNRRAVLAGANRTAGGPGAVPVQTLMWVADTGRMWMMAQAAGANTLTVSSANSAGLVQVVTAFVNALFTTVK